MSEAAEDLVLSGTITGDDGVVLEEEFVDLHEYLPDDATSSPAFALGPVSLGVSSSASPAPGGTLSRSSVVLAVVGAVGVIVKYLAKPTANVWSRIPDTCIAELPESGSLEMDTTILPLRKQRFREMAEIWYDALLTWASEFDLSDKTADWTDIPVSWFVGFFLRKVNRQQVIDFICMVVIDPAQYILSNPMFRPEDLLQLPRISKSDFQWGCYFDLFTDVMTGRVVGWYTGSATSFGFPYFPGGLLGRLLSYFPKTLVPKYGHERWLARLRTPTSTVNANFRRVTDYSSMSAYHRIYSNVLETFLMTLIGFNVEFTADGKIENLPKGTPKRVQEIRRLMGFKTFANVEYLNKVLPVKQGVSSDIRYTDNGTRRCANPDAQCPATDPPSWVSWSINGLLQTPEYLCSACYRFFHTNHKHRPQTVIDKHTESKEAEQQGCWWCATPFEELGTKDRKNRPAALNVYICKPCYEIWKENKILLPIAGLDYPIDHIFRCESSDCKDSSGTTRSDTSAALKWFFETDGQGTLHCEECHCQPPYIQTKNAKATIKRIRNDASAGKLKFHQLDRSECLHKQLSGFLQYCERVFGFEISGTKPEEKAVSLKNIKAARLSIDPAEALVSAASIIGDDSSASTSVTSAISVDTSATSVDPLPGSVAGPSKPKSKSKPRPKSSKRKALGTLEHDSDAESLRSNQGLTSVRTGKRRATAAVIDFDDYDEHDDEASDDDPAYPDLTWEYRPRATRSRRPSRPA
nr:hypothetical protein LTR18_002216 [Exophiala xenobiotica]